MTCGQLSVMHIFFITIMLPSIIGDGCVTDKLSVDTIVNITHVSATLFHDRMRSVIGVFVVQ